MAISINSLEILQKYLNGVMIRAEHHANNVEGISLTLLGAIIWKSDREIEVREYLGTPANMIWFWINENRYVLNYNHSEECIDLKSRSNSGDVIISFDNNSTYDDIINTFNNL